MQHVASLVADVSLLAYAIVLAAGVLTSLGPCNLAMIPVIVAYVAGGTEVPRARAVALSVSFACGSAVTFTALGVVAALAGGIFGQAHSALYYVLALLCIALGLNMLGWLEIRLPGISTHAVAGRTGKGVAGAFLLGLTLGLAGSQCGTPALVAILSVVMAKGKLAYGASLLFTYGVGRGVPIVLAGASAGALRSSQRLAAISAGMEKAAGVVMLLVGFYFIWAA